MRAEACWSHAWVNQRGLRSRNKVQYYLAVRRSWSWLGRHLQCMWTHVVQITIPITFWIAIRNVFRNVILAHVNTANVYQEFCLAKDKDKTWDHSQMHKLYYKLYQNSNISLTILKYLFGDTLTNTHKLKHICSKWCTISPHVCNAIQMSMWFSLMKFHLIQFEADWSITLLFLHILLLEIYVKVWLGHKFI